MDNAVLKATQLCVWKGVFYRITMAFVLFYIWFYSIAVALFLLLLLLLLLSSLLRCCCCLYCYTVRFCHGCCWCCCTVQDRLCISVVHIVVLLCIIIRIFVVPIRSDPNVLSSIEWYIITNLPYPQPRFEPNKDTLLLRWSTVLPISDRPLFSEEV